MPLDQVVGNPELAAKEFLRCLDFFVRISEQLRIGKIERRREADRQIVAQAILRQRQTIAVGDQPARRRDIENVSPRQLLSLESWDDGFLERSRLRARRRFRLPEGERGRDA
jgi:hypothetical protein